MAKSNSPLFSISAHGKLAKKLSYHSRLSKNFVRKFHYPKKAPSQDQYTKRVLLGLLTAHWQILSDAQRAVWDSDAEALGEKISGFNYFVRSGISDLASVHGLLFYANFNELSGGTTYDKAGSGNNGTFSPSYPSNAPQRVNFINPRFGKALRFDGVDDKVDFGTSSNLRIFSAATWTIELWAHLLGTGDTFQDLINFQFHNPRIYVMINDAYLGLASNVASVYTDIFYTLDNDFPMNRDNHVAITSDASDIICYINGKICASVSRVVFDDPTSDLMIAGPGWNGENVNGFIDEIRFYNRTLSQAEIIKHVRLLRTNSPRQVLPI